MKEGLANDWLSHDDVIVVLRRRNVGASIGGEGLLELVVERLVWFLGIFPGREKGYC